MFCMVKATFIISVYVKISSGLSTDLICSMKAYRFINMTIGVKSVPAPLAAAALAWSALNSSSLLAAMLLIAKH